MDLTNELEAWEEQEQYQDNISWPIFLPDEWAKDLGMLKKEDHKLSEEEIKAYAVEITALRLEIMEKAIRKDKPYVDPRKRSEDDEVLPETPLQRQYTKARQGLYKEPVSYSKDEDYPTRCFKKRKNHELSQLEKVSIVYDIKVKYQTYKDTMRKFRVGNGTIVKLIY
jgi:hypothetical protein